MSTNPITTEYTINELFSMPFLQSFESGGKVRNFKTGQAPNSFDSKSATENSSLATMAPIFPKILIYGIAGLAVIGIAIILIKFRTEEESKHSVRTI